MKQIAASLRRVNTWTAIACLALLGWLIDSLLWFLEGHALTLAGFMTYLAHFNPKSFSQPNVVLHKSLP